MRISPVSMHSNRVVRNFKGNLTKAQEERLSYLQNKHAMAQAMVEGFNYYALDEDETKELSDLISKKNSANEIKQNVPKNNYSCDETPYGVPLSTFYGDWAR